MSLVMPSLSHEQQQAAAERIQDLIMKGMGSGQAIAQVAAEIRAEHVGGDITVCFDDENEG